MAFWLMAREAGLTRITFVPGYGGKVWEMAVLEFIQGWFVCRLWEYQFIKGTPPTGTPRDIVYISVQHNNFVSKNVQSRYAHSFNLP